MPFHRLNFNLIWLHCPAKPAMTGNKKMSFDPTRDIISDIQITILNIYRKLKPRTMNCRFRIENQCASLADNRGQTLVWLRVESWVDSESNAFCLSHELIGIEKMVKHFESWVNLNQYLRNPCWVMNRFWVTSWKTAWVMSWIDSCLRDTVWSMSWLDQGTWVEYPKKVTNSTLERKAQKSSTKMSESPPKVNISTLAIDKQLIRIIESWLDSNQYSR